MRVALALLAAALAFTPAASAQSFPTRTVRIIVPYSVGLGPDVVLRAVADALAQKWKESVIIENRPGASGVVALSEVKKTPADGHTLFLGDAGSLAVAPYLHANLPYDPVRDFVPVSTIFRATFFVWTATGSRFGSLSDMLREARANPGRVNYASFGSGHVSELLMESFAQKAGIDLLAVRFKDGGQMISSAANGDIDLLPLSFNSVAGMVKGGKLRPLAIGATRRSRDFPGVPTLAEAGGPAMEMRPWAALLAVAGTPAPVVETIRRDVLAVLAAPEVRQRIEELGYDLLGSTPGELSDLMRAESMVYTDLVRAGRIRAD